MCTVVAMPEEQRGFSDASPSADPPVKKPPVKNTFIHFDIKEMEPGEQRSGKVRSLRRASTDPHSPPPAVSRPSLPPAAVPAAVPEARPETASTSLSSTPRGASSGTPPPRPTARQEEEEEDSLPYGASTPSTVSWPCTPPGSPQGYPLRKADLQGFLLPVPAFPASLAPPVTAERPEQAPLSLPAPLQAVAPAAPRPISLAEASTPPRTTSPKAIALAEEIPDKEASRARTTPTRGCPGEQATPEWTPEIQPQWWPSAQTASAGPAPAPASMAPASAKVGASASAGPISAPGNSPASPFLLFDDGGVLFGFTLRRADGYGLGMNFVRSDGDRALLVQSVLAGGAVESWNRQVVGSPNAGKAVVPGDKLVRVNAVDGSCDAMVGECLEKHLVKLLFVRGGLDYSVPLAWLAAAEGRAGTAAGGAANPARGGGSPGENASPPCEQQPPPATA